MRTMPSTTQNSTELCSWPLIRLVRPTGTQEEQDDREQERDDDRAGPHAARGSPGALRPARRAGAGRWRRPPARGSRSPATRRARRRRARSAGAAGDGAADRGERERADLDLAERGLLGRAVGLLAQLLGAGLAHRDGPVGARRASSRPPARPGRPRARRAGRSARRLARARPPRRPGLRSSASRSRRSPSRAAAPAARWRVPPHPCRTRGHDRTATRPWLGGGAALGHAPLEALDAPTGVDQLLASGVEGMAVGADLDVQLLLGRARDELVAAGAAHVGLARSWGGCLSFIVEPL